MEKAAIALGLVVPSIIVMLGSAAAGPQTIWKKGGSVRGTCTATVAGAPLMSGPCSGAGHGDSVFVTAERDGCSIELTKNARGVTGKIFAYKDNCGDLNEDVNLGVFTADSACWRSTSARVCIEPSR